MSDPFSIAAGVVGIVSGVLALGGAAFSFTDNVSAAGQELKAFADEIDQFGAIWHQAEEKVRIRRSDVGADFETAFTHWTETTTHLLQEAHDGIQRFKKMDERQLRKESQSIFSRTVIRRARQDRLLAYMNKATIKVQRSRLATARQSLNEWMILLLIAKRSPSPSEIDKIQALHRAHSKSKMRQEIEEDYAGLPHRDVSLPIEHLVRRYSPKLSKSLESLDRDGGFAGGNDNDAPLEHDPEEHQRQLNDMENKLRDAYLKLWELHDATEEKDAAEAGWNQVHVAYEAIQESYQELFRNYTTAMNEISRLTENGHKLKAAYDEAVENAQKYQTVWMEEARIRTGLQHQLAQERGNSQAAITEAQKKHAEINDFARAQTNIADSLRIQLTEKERNLMNINAELERLRSTTEARQAQIEEIGALRLEREKQSNRMSGLERRNAELVQMANRYKTERNALRTGRGSQGYQSKRSHSSEAGDSGYGSADGSYWGSSVTGSHHGNSIAGSHGHSSVSGSYGHGQQRYSRSPSPSHSGRPSSSTRLASSQTKKSPAKAYNNRGCEVSDLNKPNDGSYYHNFPESMQTGATAREGASRPTVRSQSRAVPFREPTAHRKMVRRKRSVMASWFS